MVSRLFLWRYAIHLAHRTIKPDWEGPLWRAGYRHFVVDAPFYNRMGERFAPDITLVGPDDWIVLELTTGPKSKRSNIDHYRTLAPEFLQSDHSLPVPRGGRAPIPIVMRTQTNVPDGCTQIVLGNQVAVSGLDDIPDQALRQGLRDLDGSTLSHVPQVRLAFVPESTQGEVREGLIPSVKSLLTVPGKSATIHSLVEDGLDFLWARVSVQGRSTLMAKVREAMNDLVTPTGGPLSDYLSARDTGYSARGQAPPHPNSMERIEQLLGEWVGRSLPGRQAQVSEFGTLPEGADGGS